MRALVLATVLALPLLLRAGDEAVDLAVGFRTDTANTHLPWYQLAPGEFPPRGFEHRVVGDLVEADFLHRRGRLRDDRGELIDFALLPCGHVSRHHASADLRDVPLGTRCTVLLFQDGQGAFTRAAALLDHFSEVAAQGATYRLDEVRTADGVLRVTRQGPGSPAAAASELRVDARTVVWKGDRRVALDDLAQGDALLLDLAGGGAGRPLRCTGVWAGADAHARASEVQRRAHHAFIRARGIPARIERVERDGRLVLSPFSRDRASLLALYRDEDIAPAQRAKEGHRFDVVVANDELRTYNPPVDRQHSWLLEVREVPGDRHGSGGEQWIFKPPLLLEGFRAGRLVRVFMQHRWKVEDMPFGEGLYEHGFETGDDVPDLWPYRTDTANAHLPWYQLRTGEFPPDRSAHRVGGELLEVDAGGRGGRLRLDGGGETVAFTLPPFASVLHLGADAELADLPLGIHCWFHLHQDGQGAFTRAALIEDDCSDLLRSRLTYRIEHVDAAAGIVHIARQLPPIRNYQDAMITPPDVGRLELAVGDGTRAWKGDQRCALADLAVGDVLLMNRSGAITSSSQGRCSDLWIGAGTHAAISERQRLRQRARTKAQGMPAWIDGIDGRKLTILFFAGVRADFPPLLDGDPWGKPVFVRRCDDQLRPLDGGLEQMGFADHLREDATAGTYGCSGVRWVIETQRPGTWAKGQVIRVFKEGWPLPEGTAVGK
jgi:hypothetical protein